jgi:acetolactate synthase-1/2/3 large subunit
LEEAWHRKSRVDPAWCDRRRYFAAQSRDAGVISGAPGRQGPEERSGHVFTLCGGHIIDIYDGCVDEGIRITTCGMSRWRRTRPTATPVKQANSAASRRRVRCTNAVTGIATAFRSEVRCCTSAARALTQHKMGSLQDLPHVD